MTPDALPIDGKRQTVLGGEGRDVPGNDADGGGPPPHSDKHIDSPLESIGKAVTEPVRDAADEDSDEHPGGS
jgi:hypothetical protein